MECKFNLGFFVNKLAALEFIGTMLCCNWFIMTSVKGIDGNNPAVAMQVMRDLSSEG